MPPSSTVTSRGLRPISTGRASWWCPRRSPLLIDRYLSDATEVDVDCLADGKDTFIAGIMEHIEEAGIHSGDSACALPPHSLSSARPSPNSNGKPARWRWRSMWRADERAIRHQGRRHLCAGGQSARLAHGAVRRQSDRPAGRQDRGARDGGRKPRQLQAKRRHLQAPGGEGSGVPVRALPRGRYRARPGDEIDRRSDGDRRLVRDRLRQEPDRRRHDRCRARAPCSSR